ncbi:InlB B-repeat-containing protein [Candidatus Bathycorpusculum sp.]|uniref:InlB B-repeat-containing protein n=1 Tax=Candidatus Bathycorpusculum sp. TaxID=2994959 RepID=UPI00281A3DB3|nr:InlB B-repeat-containing protein [Candidatus Termitimicrobium sp.]MCL2686327.1 InlB B-repeat-containing protein [Candidatus Termitimicrobium sp.]
MTKVRPSLNFNLKRYRKNTFLSLLSLMFVALLLSSPIISVVRGETYAIIYTFDMGGTNPISNPATYNNAYDTLIADAYDPVYEFMGWAITYWINGTQVLEPQRDLVISAGTIGLIELTAIFDTSPRGFPITYELNGGVNHPLNREKYFGDNEYFPIVISAPYRLGYEFAGWTAIYSDGTLPVTTPTTSLSIVDGTTGAITLTATWNGPINYNINYADSGGHSGPSSYNVEILPLDVGIPSRPGHVFLYWMAICANGSWKQMPGSVISTGTTGDITLRAMWDPPNTADYVIHYYLTGTTASVAPSVTKFDIIASTVTEYAPPIAGYTIVGPTSKSAVLNLTNNEFIFYYTPENIAINYGLTYNGNGHTSGSVPVDAASPYASGSLVQVLGQGNLVRTGHVFLGWALNSYAVTPIYVEGSTFTILSDTTLFAVWEQTLYTVTYQPGAHGIFAEQVTDNLAYGDPTPVSPPVTAEDGWRFTSWLPTQSATVTGNAVYVAQWEIIPKLEPDLFVVRFVDWNDTLLKEETVEYGHSATAPDNPSRSGYTFIGWSPAFNNIVSDLTVRAQYIQNDDGNGGGSSGSSDNKDDGGYSRLPNRPYSSVPVQKVPPSNDSEPKDDPDDVPTPSPEPEEPLATWALANLVFSIIGLIALLVVICVLLQKRQKQTQKKAISKVCLFTAFILGIAGILVFFLTQDLSLQMGTVDSWTIVNAALFVSEILTLIFFYLSIQKDANRQKSKTSASSHLQSPKN